MGASNWKGASKEDVIGSRIDEDEAVDRLKEILGGFGGLGGDFLGKFLEDDVEEWKQRIGNASTQFSNEHKNGGKIRRESAEKAWKSYCEEVFQEWQSDAMVSTEMKYRTFEEALAQMKGGLNGQFDIESF
ncbi:hypothetical protein ONS95_009260 [Cadophora gregata]|uniref:uncharacterized protein n=1 Tax=Cadophora gregata TaxID=51156 RepID=UPI0026DCE832|nr:uncharacterized protein ONS95_009260 [Cadophora gregata]KAK0124288.1 hypothetical protein ONS95_009260 [Cadophora gregata]